MRLSDAAPDVPAAPAPAARIVLALALAYAAVVAIVTQAPARTLGHDEAVYAVGARGLLDGDVADEFPLHRSIGMRVLALPGVAAGGDERALRFPFVLIGFAYLAAMYVIGRRHGGPAAGALAVAAQATAPQWQWRASEVLSDVPSALCLLGVAALCGGTTRGRWHAVAAGALAAAACYLRYASAPVVALIFGVALVGDPARRRWLVGAAAAGLALLVPFLVWSAARTGSPLGVLDVGERMARRDYPGHGLVYYLRTWPVLLAGPVMGALAAIGVVVGVAAWRRGAADRMGGAPADRHAAVRARRLFAAAGIGQIVVLGWRVHGEARFILFALSALTIVGAAWLAADRRRWRIALVVVAASAIPSAWWTTARLAQLTAAREPFAAAVAAIRADRARPPTHPDRACLVLSTEVPMSIWYTGCRAIQVDDWGFDPDRVRDATQIYLLEARGLPRSIGNAEPQTRARLGWRPIACAEPARFCVWKATAVPAPAAPAPAVPAPAVPAPAVPTPAAP